MLIRQMQFEVHPFGYHICLGGGVLNMGYSMKDLDLFFLKMNTEDPDVDPLMAYLDRTLGSLEPMASGFDDSEGYVEKLALRFRRLLKVHVDGKRIDLFIQ